MKLYYLHEDGKDSGPFTLGQLRSMWQAGKITVATRYFCQGMDRWHELADMIPVLQRKTEPNLPAVQAPPPRTSRETLETIPSDTLNPTSGFFMKPGETQPSGVTTRTGSSGAAAVMSFFIPGLGQLYNGRFGAALGFFFGIPLCFGIGCALIAEGVDVLGTAIMFLGLVLWVYCIVHAYRSEMPAD